jgi:hypothetical protein
VSTTNSLDLYSLLPAIYRIRDAERGYPLRGFLGLISTQAQLLKTNIDGLWDDLFIETCADWVIPYIGDLVANNPISENIAQTRADVARTIYYRRRKGTLPMLEEMAGDVTGWAAHAVAFFEELGWSQNLNHLRFHPDVPPNGFTAATDPFAVDRVGTVLLRDLDVLDRLGGPFDTTTHTVDVRPPCQFTGWYNIRNIGFFLWRLEQYFMQGSAPLKSALYTDGFYFSPLGNPAPLFTNPAPAPQGTQLVTETQVPAPIRKVAFYFQPGNYIPSSFAIYHGATTANPILPANIVCGDLSNWTPPPTGKVAVDVALGRFAFAPGETPADGVTVSYTYGFSGDMGGGPYDRTSLATVAGDPGPAIPGTVANPVALGLLIPVSATAAATTISQAILAWNPAVNPQAVIQIEDNRTYVESLAIPFPVVAVPPGQPSPILVIQAANQLRPTLLGNITLTGGSGSEEAILNGLLIAGNLHVEANLGLVEIVHCTLVPGEGLDEQGQPVQPDAPSILVDDPADNLQMLIDHSVTGPLRLPEEMVGLTIRDSIIDSPRRDAPADFVPVLISGNLSPFPALTSLAPVVNVTIGDEGPYLAVLPNLPAVTTLADARDALQTAIQSAHTTVPFTEARVITVANRLLVLPGSDEELVIEVAGSDPTASELRLDPTSARQTSAVVSGPLPAAIALTAVAPALNVTVGTDGTNTATFALSPTSVPQARDQLQAAIRAAGATPGFTGALVGNVGNQLVVVSGDGGGPITFNTAPADATTLTQLLLATQRPALAADDAGDVPGPISSILRTTIFGEVYVQQLLLASEVIFTSVVLSKRRQNACVRFSFVPEGSITPKRYRCQPDFEIQEETEAAEQAAAANGTALSPAELDAIRDDVRPWLQPSFTDTQYGRPGYAQLFVNCPKQIRTGAEDGSEMGAFCFLKQPQRVTSLRVRLQEYLPFGLQAGLIYVT